MTRTWKALTDFTFVLQSVRGLLAGVPEFDDVLAEAFCRHKVQMIRVSACPTAEIRALGNVVVPVRNSLTREEKTLLFGFELFGRAAASALALFFRGISFAKAKFREALIMVLRKKYAHDGLSVKILVEDERLYRTGGGIKVLSSDCRQCTALLAKCRRNSEGGRVNGRAELRIGDARRVRRYSRLQNGKISRGMHRKRSRANLRGF